MLSVIIRRSVRGISSQPSLYRPFSTTSHVYSRKVEAEDEKEEETFELGRNREEEYFRKRDLELMRKYAEKAAEEAKKHIKEMKKETSKQLEEHTKAIKNQIEDIKKQDETSRQIQELTKQLEQIRIAIENLQKKQE